jgi:hypothetical protein
MSLQDRYPAYGGRGPADLRVGLGLGAVATIFMILRVYVRLRVNKFGTTALIWALVAWVGTVAWNLSGTKRLTGDIAYNDYYTMFRRDFHSPWAWK